MVSELEPVEFDEATLATVDRWLEYRAWHSRVPGVQVAVGVAGEVLLSRAYGYADLERRTPMRSDHLFRIASHSKTFTATLVLQLVEQGRVGLDDPIGTHLPQLADEPELAAIAVRELLEHTGGVLRDGLDGDYWQFDRPFPGADELLAMVQAGGMKTAAGELFGYSNLGYSLLGLLVEAVTGLPFGQAAWDRILGPLGLADTASDYPEDRRADYAVGYSGLHLGPRVPLAHIPTAAMAAATGFTSTATDLVAYFGAHRLGDPRLLSDRSKRRMQRLANPADPEHPEAGGYGLGMIVDRIDGTTYVGHSGGYPGHITKTLLDPTNGLAVSVLTNAIDGPATPLARGVVQLLTRGRTNAERTLAEVDGTASPDREAADGAAADAGTPAWTGRYASTWGVTDIACLGGRLVALDPTAAAPLEEVDELADLGDGTLRIAAGKGYGSVGELVTREVVDGAVSWLRYGGMRMRPFPDLPEQSAEPAAGR